MSIESSVSETTPLRRPESQSSSEDVVLKTPSTALTTQTTSGNVASVNNSARNNYYNSNSNNITNSGTLTNAAALPTTVAIANHNNNNIEIRLGHTVSGVSGDTQSMMDTNKRILCRVGLDVLILLCVGFPILIFFLCGDSYKRGFFCDDESLKHPFKESTVRNWMLYIIGLVIPISVILIVEIIRSKQNARTSNGNNTTRRYVFMDYEIPDWLVESYKKIGIFGFGAAVSQLTTDIAKYSIGRLRPHFFAVCQPVMKDKTTCDDEVNVGKYIEDFECLGVGSSARMLKEVRLSFPSGHSSFTFFTMCYLALYLQSRMTWRGSKLLRHFLQFLFVMIAWYTALSRVSDYKHHWSDVLAGSLIGALTAVIVACFVSDLFEQRTTKTYVLPRTTQDTVLPTVPANGH